MMLSRLRLLLVVWGVWSSLARVSSGEHVEASTGKVEASSMLDAKKKQVEALVEWVRSKGGFVDTQKLDILQPTGTGTGTGLFAKEAIQAGDLLMEIPPSCIVSGNPEKAFDEMQCDTIRKLIREFKLGDESSYAPFIQYLATLPKGRLPSSWSETARALIRRLLGVMTRDENQRLPPEDVTGWITHEFVQGCRGDPKNTMEHHIALLTIQRGWGSDMVPLLDLVNHHSDVVNKVNTQTNALDLDTADTGASARLVATRDVAVGQELYLSFVGEEGEVVDTADLFRDRGFVESYPQQWDIPGRGFMMAFALTTTTTDTSNNDLTFTWTSEPPFLAGRTDAARQWIDDTLEYIGDEWTRVDNMWLDESTLHAVASLPPHERVLLNEYAQALTKALECLYAELEQISEDQEDGCDDGDNDGTCHISASRYNSLDMRFDDTYSQVDTCDQDAELDFSHHTVIEEIQSPYQKITFDQDPVTNNTCFLLDAIYQICASYRPHYHEMMVHYSARFLKNIKRVIFIGGGDSMLLHEVLKYPSLEMVIGLELDQTVTRNSFKYFGTQPHWDNDKVQWWFGDAAKSLLMLPKEYFGTFDLVLVDLSETVMSNTVTGGLDIMSALSLLLKQDGIFLKNEMYFHSLSKVFKKTIQIHYYDVPLVCSQCMVLGSNEIDFIQTELTDHNVETVHQPSIEPDTDFASVHDYMSNPSADRHCKSDSDDDEPVEQERSPGILMIVEAENSSNDLEPSEKVMDLLVQALEKEELGVLSASASDNEGTGGMVTIFFKEGYVVARTWPAKNYCALDIHLWSTFHKLENLKNSLLEAVGSAAKDSSAFRIVAPGMFGVDTWKDDEVRKGPKFTQDCDEPSVQVDASLPIENVVSAVLDETMSTLLLQEKATVVVLCGQKSEPCSSIDHLAKHDSVGSVIPLWACSNIEGEIEYLKDSATRKYTCEKEIASILKANLKKVDAIVVDLSAPFAMGQIMLKIVSTRKNRKKMFATDILAIAPGVDLTEEWRRHFVDQLRQYYNKEPGFKANVFFNTTDTSIEVTTISSGDLNFINNLRKVTAQVEERTSLVGDIRHIGGAEFTMQEDFNPSQFFLHDAYDQQGPYSQWISQQPLGLQTVFQLQQKKRFGKPFSINKVKEMLGNAFSVMGIETTPEEFTDQGDGIVIFATWTGGNVIILWDGRDLVGINLFTYEESISFASSFKDAFMGTIMKVALRDEMPRGHGRVVNFKKDLEPHRLHPAWAVGLDS